MKTALFSLVLFFQSLRTDAGSLFLNGIDVSNAKNQTLKGVDIHINENGDVYISAPNYTIRQEDDFLPLSRKPEAKIVAPKHTEEPQKLERTPQPLEEQGPKDPAVKTPEVKT